MRSAGRKLPFILFVITLAITAAAIFAQQQSRTTESIWGPRYRALQQIRPTERHPFRHGNNSLNRLKHWNEVAVDSSGLDHTPVAPGENRVFGEQVGPGRSSRSMAIVHIAIFDAINAIEGKFESYSNLRRVHENTSVDSAIA